MAGRPDAPGRDDIYRPKRKPRFRVAYDPNHSVFTTLAAFCDATDSPEPQTPCRIVHSLNPFPAPPGTEHHRAQRVTLASLDTARRVSRQLHPEIEVVLAKVTTEPDDPPLPVAFDRHHEIRSSILDLHAFQVARPLPLVMDLLTAIDLAPDDIFVFTNVDIAVTPGFYPFLAELFARGADCAIINRRRSRAATATNATCG